MTHAKSFQLISIGIYTIVASIGSKILSIHWIHIFNTLMLSAILYQILEWKYDWVEPEEENNADENNTN